MASSSEFRNMEMPGVPKEMRESVTSAFDALANWKDEIDTANERCLKKVLDHTGTVAKAMGWPEQSIRATQEYLEKVANTQTEIIDQFIEGWKRQLRSQSGPTAVPRAFAEMVPGLTAPAMMGGMPAFSTFSPWAFWMQAAEMWQRTLMPEQFSRDRSRH
jgi:hypothetical protein